MKKNNHIFLAFGLLVVLLSDCSVNRAEIDNSLKQYFDETQTEGSFTMMSNSSGKVTVYNLALDTARFSPAGTFIVPAALIGLETGRITDEKMVIKWDGINRTLPNGDTAANWNQDLDFTSAFKSGALPYFYQVVKKIGKDTLQHWVDSLGYGNKNLGKQFDSSWLNQSLTISADEQLGMMKRLYFDQLPFQKRTQQIVRDGLSKDDNTLYKFSYVASTGFNAQQQPVTWVSGWIEENKHPYFFTTVVTKPSKGANLNEVAVSITKKILKQYGFFEGKK